MVWMEVNCSWLEARLLVRSVRGRPREAVDFPEVLQKRKPKARLYIANHLYMTIDFVSEIVESGNMIFLSAFVYILEMFKRKT